MTSQCWGYKTVDGPSMSIYSAIDTTFIISVICDVLEGGHIQSTIVIHSVGGIMMGK